jgi:hypothetical protein
MTWRRSWTSLVIVLVCADLRISNAWTNFAAPPQASVRATPISLTPSIFAPGVISTEADEIGGSLSTDGREFYFVVFSPYTTQPDLGLICVSRLEQGRWGKPQALPFSGDYLNLPPRISPDGKRLYFASNRPIPGISGRGLWIWYVERHGSEWSVPQALPPPINSETSRFNIDPSVASDGTLYFTSSRDGAGIAIYRSRLLNGVYQNPERLGPEINFEGAYNWQPYIAPDQRFLIYGAQTVDVYPFKKLPDELIAAGNPYARTDLYISESRDGKWMPAHHLEHGINTAADESYPFVTADGLTLFFTSERSEFIVPLPERISHSQLEKNLRSIYNGRGNIFTISTDALELHR